MLNRDEWRKVEADGIWRQFTLFFIHNVRYVYTFSVEDNTMFIDLSSEIFLEICHWKWEKHLKTKNLCQNFN